MEAVIPARCHRKEQIHYDKKLYKQRKRIERLFGKLKQNRRIATHFERNDSHFMAWVYLAAQSSGCPH